MGPGSLVICKADPLNVGKMLVLSVEGDGLLLCETTERDATGHFFRDKFHPLELELFEIWDRAAHA